MSPTKIVTALYTFLRKEVVRILRIWKQTLLPSVITTTLYFLIFGTFIGSKLPAVGGYSYIQFIVPGLVMLAVITNSFQNTISTFFFAKFQKNIEEILVSPLPYWSVVLGYLLGGLFRGLLVGILVLIVALFFTHLAIHSLLVIVLFMILTSLLFALAGLLNGLFAKNIDDIAIIPTFVLTPLTYLGGVFYSVHMLPPVWQVVSKFNPVLYIVDGYRYGFLGVSDFSIYLSSSILIVTIIIFGSATLYFFKKGYGLKS